MKLLVCVLNETQRLNELLKAMTELGISGATVIESQGMENVLAKNNPVVAGLRHLVTQGRSFNYTIFSVVEDDSVADRTMKAIEAHLLPGTRPGTHGVAFTVSVDKFVHFHPDGPKVRHAKVTPDALISEDGTDCESTFERAMLAALKRAETTPPGLLAKLSGGIKSFMKTGTGKDLKERRRAPRFRCDYQVTAIVDGVSVEATVTDIGLFGLTIQCPAKLTPQSLLKLQPPKECGPERQETVECTVTTCHQGDEGSHLCGLAYHESAEVLSGSWIAFLLRELGYSLAHLTQRRKARRVPTQLAAELQSYDGEVSVPATILDIGIQGALVEAAAKWEKGTEVGLLLGPHERKEALYLEGIIVGARENGEKWLHSVRFYALETKRLEKLGNIIIEIVKKPAPSAT